MMRIALLGLLALAACDETVPAATRPDASGNGDVAMQSAAEKECAQLTDYSPEKLQAATPEKRTLMEREYKSCVAKVTAGGS